MKEALRDAENAILVARQSLFCSWFWSHGCELLHKSRVLEASGCYIIKKIKEKATKTLEDTQNT